MSGKQNHKNNKISSNYTQNIFCFDVFCDFEFFSGAENFGFDVASIVNINETKNIGAVKSTSSLPLST